MVHAAVRVREDPIAQHSLGQPGYVLLGIVAMYRNQDKQPTTDFADELAVDPHGGFGNAL
jgi:hypothetical protein